MRDSETVMQISQTMIPSRLLLVMLVALGCAAAAVVEMEAASGETLTTAGGVRSTGGPTTAKELTWKEEHKVAIGVTIAVVSVVIFLAILVMGYMVHRWKK